MKKVIALLAVCGFAIALVACGGKKEEASSNDSTATVTETPAPAADSASTMASDSVKADSAVAK